MHTMRLLVTLAFLVFTGAFILTRTCRAFVFFATYAQFAIVTWIFSNKTIKNKLKKYPYIRHHNDIVDPYKCRA